jgi:phage terminase small subunit
MAEKKLSAQQERFCQEYVVDLNATQAAIRANYSEKTAGPCASRLLTKDNIKKRIEQLQAPKVKKIEASAERVIKELSRIAFSDIRSLFDEDDNLKPIKDMTEAEAAVLSAVDIDSIYSGQGADRIKIGCASKLKLWNKLKALELLGQHLTLFRDGKWDESDGEPDEVYL